MVVFVAAPSTFIRYAPEGPRGQAQRHGERDCDGQLLLVTWLLGGGGGERTRGLRRLLHQALQEGGLKTMMIRDKTMRHPYIGLNHVHVQNK